MVSRQLGATGLASLLFPLLCSQVSLSGAGALCYRCRNYFNAAGNIRNYCRKKILSIEALNPKSFKHLL